MLHLEYDPRAATADHTAARNQDLVDSIGRCVIAHPSYRPDLAPSDFYLFLHLKQNLSGKHFDNTEEVKKYVSKLLARVQAAEIYEEGNQNLVLRHNKCRNKQGDCIQKYEHIESRNNIFVMLASLFYNKTTFTAANILTSQYRLYLYKTLELNA